MDSNEFQNYIEKVVALSRAETLLSSPQLTLGELIEQIEKCNIKKSDGEHKTVSYDFGTATPTSLASWRGSYAELALGYKLSGYDNPEQHFTEITAETLLEELKGAIGKTYTGWKGGEFTMSEKTSVWVANEGNAGNTAIVGVMDGGWQLILLTAYCNF